MEDYKRLLQSCLEAGIPILSLDTCCRLLAIVYVIGGSMEAFTHNGKLMADWQYAQQRLNIVGGETPNEEVALLIKQYVNELETYYANAAYSGNSSSPLAKEHPEWVVEFMTKRYGIEHLWI